MWGWVATCGVRAAILQSPDCASRQLRARATRCFVFALLSKRASFIADSDARLQIPHALRVWFDLGSRGCGLPTDLRSRTVADAKQDWVSCIRYGDWSGHEDLCMPGAILEQSWSLCCLTDLCSAVVTHTRKARSLKCLKRHVSNQKSSCGAESRRLRCSLLFWTVLSFATSVSDQGDITPHSMRGLCSWLPCWPARSSPSDEDEGESTESLLRTEVYSTDQLTAVAMRLKALVRRQMHVSREMSKNRQSSLAEALLFPITSAAWVFGGEDEDEAPEIGMSFYQ